MTFWGERHVNLLLERRVVAVDAAAHRVTLADGSAIGIVPAVEPLIAAGARVAMVSMSTNIARPRCQGRTLVVAGACPDRTKLADPADPLKLLGALDR